MIHQNDLIIQICVIIISTAARKRSFSRRRQRAWIFERHRAQLSGSCDETGWWRRCREGGAKVKKKKKEKVDE